MHVNEGAKLSLCPPAHRRVATMGVRGRRGRPGWMGGVPTTKSTAHKDTHGRHQQVRCTTSCAAPHKGWWVGKEESATHDMGCGELKAMSHFKMITGPWAQENLDPKWPRSTRGIIRKLEICDLATVAGITASCDSCHWLQHHKTQNTQNPKP